MKAIEIFEFDKKGIISQLQTLDIYLHCLLASLRNQDLPSKNIIKIVASPITLSAFSMFAIFYKEEEIEYLKNNEKLRFAGQQIILATYTTVEKYLIGKLKEYILFRLKSSDLYLTEKLFKQIPFRSLDNIRYNFKKYLDVHLPSYDIDYYTQDKCNFHPESTWAGLNLLSDIRNDVAHAGRTEKYIIASLMDCWYPFDFVQRYIIHFETDFDDFIYRDRLSERIKLC